MISWLKKIGQGIVMGLKLEAGLSPFIQQAYPQAAGAIQKVDSELTQLVGVITTVEAVGTALGLPGTDKARAAGPLIGQLIQQSAFMIGKEIADPVAYAKACQALSGDFADLLNSLKATS